MKREKNLRCVIHGSFRKHFKLIQNTHQLFTDSGIDIIAPESSKITGEIDGFVHLESDKSTDPRVVELLYLKKASELGPEGFSYYINPDGRLGTSASYELAIDHLTNTRCLFMEKLTDHPAYIPQNSVWKPKELCEYILENGHYPSPIIPEDEKHIYEMTQDLILPGSVIAVGAITVDYSSKKYKNGQEREVLMVQTHKWGNRFSIIGGKVRRNERLVDALKREILEETSLESEIEESICTFDEIKGSGYFQKGLHKVFIDYVAKVKKRKVKLNEEAKKYVWIPPTLALQELDIEPNAKETLETYIRNHKRIA